MSRYLITFKELQRKIFQKLDENSFDLILRGSFISKLNALPQDTRSMYFKQMISTMQQNNAQFDYFTGAERSQYHQRIDLSDLDAISKCNQQQGETILNAIFNYTDLDNSALVQDVQLYQMLDAFTFEQTIDIAIGLGIDIPMENQNKTTTNVIDQNTSQKIDSNQEIKYKQQKAVEKQAKSAEMKKIKQEQSVALKEQKIDEIQDTLKQDKDNIINNVIITEVDKSESNHNKEEYQKFMSTMKEKEKIPEYKPFTISRQYKPQTLGSFNRDIEILEQRKARREGRENETNKHRIKTGIYLGLFALLIATKMMYERSNANKKHIPPVVIS